MDKKSHAKRDRKPDFAKVAAVLTVLKQYPDGIWLSRLSEESKLPRMTIARYLDGVLGEFIENIGMKDENDRYIGVRVIRLKPAYRNKEFDGDTVKKMVEAHAFLRSIGK